MVDAELGILLRLTWLADEAEPEVTELASLDLDPVIDPALFRPPPGSLIAESAADALGTGGAGWTALKTVAGVAAGGLGAWIRYVPSTQKRTAEQAGDNEAPISPDGPAPERSPDGRPVGPPVNGQVLQLLHDSTTSEFAATVHEWTDFGAMLSQVPPGARRAGFLVAWACWWTRSANGRRRPTRSPRSAWRARTVTGSTTPATTGAARS